ncbi:glycoside hydrolase family 88 protein [Flavobacterium rhizosphaerae]|uniref:Glycoside hydrolase family 88 protein n=1 Tax=Flavobacterium rhizosphaerae TaxID=3163298 RepID=A0ABW8YSE5_9FLAO
MKKLYLPLVMAAFVMASCNNKQKEEEASKTEAPLEVAVKQYTLLSEKVPQGRYPKTYHADKDSLETSDSGWWCSGFYPGTLLYLDEAQNAPELKEKALTALEGLKKEQYNKSTHDLGFMMYCSFGNAERLNPHKEYEDVLMNSAKSLSTRFVPAVGCIQSWDSAEWNHAGENEMPVIIDNMMNLELLFWATKFSKDSTYYKIAVSHADTTMKNHFRDDYSSYHDVVYNKKTGDVVRRVTVQGAADESAWSRGQAWALYGYTMVYRETKDKKYLEQAQHIADFILNNPNLPKDMVPYWDFNAPNIPDAYRDSSAAAIIASALIELSTYTDGDATDTYREAADKILTTLKSPEYLAAPGTNGGFLLKHGVGNIPNKSEIDVPLSYGDYYFVEALMRAERLK